MITLALLLAAAFPQDSRENPQTATEWLDHYDYCLETNFDQILTAGSNVGKSEAATRAVVRCLPVHNGASKAIKLDLPDKRSSASRDEVADRLLNIVVTAFEARVGS